MARQWSQNHIVMILKEFVFARIFLEITKDTRLDSRLTYLANRPDIVLQAVVLVACYFVKQFITLMIR